MPTPYTKREEGAVISRTQSLRDLKFSGLLGVLLKPSENVKLTKYLLFCFYGNCLLFKCFGESFSVI